MTSGLTLRTSRVSSFFGVLRFRVEKGGFREKIFG